MARKKKKKPLNRERRIKQILNQEPEKKRGVMPPPTIRHQDKREKRNKRQDKKQKLRKEYVGKLLKIAKSILQGI